MDRRKERERTKGLVRFLTILIEVAAIATTYFKREERVGGEDPIKSQ